MKSKYVKKLRELRMSDAEKRELFNRISTSIGSSEVNKIIKYPVRSPFYSWTFITTHRFVEISAFAVILLLFTGTTTFASLGSLPGDLLYGVKTNVAEKLPYVIYRSPEKRAEYATRRIDERIYEFEKLAEKGKLTPEKTEKIEANLNQSFAQFDEDVQKIKAEKRARVGRSDTIEGQAVLPPEAAPRLMKMAIEPEKPKEEKEEIEEKLEKKLERHALKIKEIREREREEAPRALESVLERVREAQIEEENNLNLQ